MAVDFNSKERSKRRKKAAVFKILISLFIIAGIGAGLYSAPRYPQINISQVDISGNETVSKENIEQNIWQELAGNKYFFFPNKNIFLYPKEKIENAVLALDPHLNTASVSFADFQTISVNVTERKPSALWCGDIYQKDEIKPELENCFYLDKTGFIFAEAPGFSGNYYIRFYGLVSTSTSPIIGQSFVSQPNFKLLTFLTDKMKKDGFVITRIVISEDNLVEAYLEGRGKLWLSSVQDLEKQINNFETLVNSEDFKGRDKDGNLKFNYIDLRFENKLFYKL
ncbi:MAG: FtsQ-type POTRA domain-containing protein [bacterium]|nr:FtsQ-type POTRA domain-containing protein [bacterium]